MATPIPKPKIDEILWRGVETFIDPDNKFREKLEKSPNQIVIKIGIDPTRPDIHLGHAAILRKLRQFQDLGSKVIFLVGDYTAQIGDPTGKSKVRAEVEQAEVEKNMKSYVDQVGKILSTDKQVFSWIRNSDWFYNPTDLSFGQGAKAAMNFKDDKGNTTSIPLDPNSFLGKTALYENSRMQKTDLGNTATFTITLKSLLWTLKHITHSRLIDRDLFQKRLKKNEELYMHEMLYPVLQGVDSYVISQIYGSCDLEIGGSDQTFNMLMGRDVMKINNVPSQSVMSIKLLIGTDGKEKMSKSLDNYIAITDQPHDMYGKIMSIPDSLIEDYFILCSYTPIDEIKDMVSASTSGKTNPKDLKMRLAREIVEIYHGAKRAKEAEDSFIGTFSKGEIPKNLEEVELRQNQNNKLMDLLISHRMVSSKTEFRRLIKDGAVSDLESKEKILDPEFKITKDTVIRIGAKRFIKISVK